MTGLHVWEDFDGAAASKRGVAEGGEVLAVVVGEVGGGEQVGAVGEGFGEGGLAAPAADGEVVAVVEGLGDG